MCGMCGIVGDSGDQAEAAIDRMVGALRHRGPHNQEHQAFGPAHLGHTRLSILDLSAAANQPMQSRSGRTAITYNGEIYNYRELRKELASLGVTFRTTSDTEVLLEGFEIWGPDLFPRLNGIFAAALWEEGPQRLHLIRDRLGVKPLYYAEVAGGLRFSSEIYSLRRGLETTTLSEQGLAEYLWLGNPGTPLTLYEEIRQVPAGHHVTFEGGELRSAAYWVMPAGGHLKLSAGDAARRLTGLIEQAVARQLVSDVPVGVFLSGGVDSSAITLLAARHSDTPLSSYFVHFDFQTRRDERELARLVARTAGTRHEELYVEASGLPDVLSSLLRFHGQPFGDAADIPLFLLARELNGRTRVILQGDGADELFAGYDRYTLYRSRPFWRLMHHMTRPLPKLKLSRKAHAFMRLADAVDGDRASEIALLLTSSTQRTPATMVLTDAWRERIRQADPFRRYREVWARAAHTDAVQQMLYVDSQILLGDYYLQKVDRATMAWGVEVRVPFLDNDLAEFALELPSGFKQRRAQNKWILKRALRGIVPDQILDQPKQGFGVPIAEWIRGPLRPWILEVLEDPALERHALLDTASIRRLMEEDLRGFRFHAPLLWKVLLLALWLLEEF